MMSVRAVIYDTETIRSVPPRGKPRVEGIEYCKSWTDYEGMGISVVCAYDYGSDLYRIFMCDNAVQFQWLINRADVIIGFNSLKFDNNLVREFGINLPDSKSYDLLVEIWIAAGLAPTYQHGTHAGYSLNDCIRANFGITKGACGGDGAPVKWQQGKIGIVTDYCLADVCGTKKLIDKIMSTGRITDPVYPERTLEVRKPW